MNIYFSLLLALFGMVSAQQYTTPVPILKQINKHNEDGSYSYGYEAADGTYKIETKYPNGEVFGKYGYVDDSGKVRTVEYGASRRGFEPAGNEIQVPPPTLKSENYNSKPLGPNQEDDGQYREDPSVYYKDDPYANQQPSYQSRYQPQPQSIYQPQPQSIYQPQPQSIYQSRYQQPQQQPQPAYQPQFRPQTTFSNLNNYAAPQTPYYNPAPPAFPNYNQFQGHPATNVDLYTGSYTVNYRR